MAQPNNGRDVINFAYRKTSLGWSLEEINNALGGPNEHLKLWVPIPTKQTPACSYNGTQEPCIILSGKKEGMADFPPSSKYTRGHGFQLVYMRNWRGKQSYDAVLYQAVGRPQNCGSEKDCQTGDMRIYDYNGGYEHVTRASYRVSDGIWGIQSSLGNQLTINLGGSPATRK